MLSSRDVRGDSMSFDGERDARARLLARARSLLAHDRAPLLIIITAILLTSTSLALGLTADDYIHLASTRHTVPGLERAPWDLFAFVRGEDSIRSLMDQGAFPWWSDLTTRIAFLRPLSSISHWIDYTLWPTRHALIHLHSLAWFALFLLATARVYRLLSPAPWVAWLSLLFYALDDARAPLVGWIATRNQLIALTPAFLALAVHHRARSEGHRASGLLAPVLLAIGLSAGESAVQVVGYLAAHVLFLERGSLLSKLRSFAPYLVVILLWRIPYALLGYGAHGSGLYFDPGHEPLAFLGALWTRLPILLLAQFALPFSDIWDAAPVFAPGSEPFILAFAFIVLGVIVWLLRPLLRRDPVVRFWALGALIAAIPVCAGPLDDRLLAGTGLGCAALVARLVASVVEHPRSQRTGYLVAALALFHGVIAPLFLPVRTLAVDSFERMMVRADRSIPSTPELSEQTLVAINPPVDLFSMYWPFYREAHGLTRPAHFYWLATGVTEIAIERVDAQTLRVRPKLGFLSNSSQWMLRSLSNPLAVGEKIELKEATIVVTSLTKDQRPQEIDVHFKAPLESPTLRFVQWGRRNYVPFVPPAVGQSVIVPGVDMIAALHGD